MSNKHELAKLYKLSSKGKVQENHIIVFERDDGTAAIKTFRGYVGGKITCDEPTLITEGKNIGRANETTILEQAMMEAKSKWNKKRDEGYCLSIEETMNNVVILPMLASKYKDQKKHIRFPAILQRKFDGCFVGSTKIMTDSGEIEIEKIVENKMNVNVLSYNEKSKEFEYKPVVGWFDNGKSEYTEWSDVIPENGRRKRNTNNHKYLTENHGWVKTSELNSDVHKILDNSYSFRKNCLIAGTLLGDSMLSVDKRAGGNSYRLTFSHQNIELFDFKRKLIGIDGSVVDYTSGYGSECKRFVSKALTNTDFPIHLFYFTGHSENCGKRKHLTYDTVKKYITPEALSLWIADDGSIRYNNNNKHTPILQLSTHSHSVEQIDIFVEYFQKVWKCNPSKIVDKRVDIDEKTSGVWLHFNTKDTLYLLNQLCKFACKGVEDKYYFTEKIEYIKENKDEFRFVSFSKSNSLFSSPMQKYDIEVMDNHNYIANGTVVHNCRVIISKKPDGSVSLMTRGGKEFPGLNHIRDAIKDVLEVGQFIDGELYSHEITFQEIVGLVKRETPKPGDEQKVKLIGVRAYDCFKIGTDEDFETRYSVLEKLISGIDKFELVENIEVFSDAEIMPLHDKFVLEGYEGAIIRNKKGFYELDNRSKNLQKIKVFDDAEFEVVGYKEGSGNETGCVVWRCKTKEDKEFDCRPRGIRSQRMDWFENGEKYIGKMLTVRYFGFTDDNKPRHPVGIIFRDYED